MIKRKKKLLIFALIISCCIAGAAGAVNAFSSYGEKESNDATMVVYATENVLANINGCEFKGGVSSPETTDIPYKGVEVIASDKVSRFKYNGIVNLKNIKNFIEFMLVPEKTGVAEANDIVIKLTDVYDEDKFLTMQFDSTLAGHYPGSTWVKFSESNKYKGFGIVPVGGEHPLIYQYTKLDGGTQFCFNWAGKIESRSWYTMKMQYRPDEKAIYGDNRTDSQWGAEYRLAFDYSDPTYLGANVFDGFTTEEVYISVEVSTISRAHMLVTSIGGVDLSADTVDNYRPQISLNTTEYGGELPYGVAGENASYPVPEAIAYCPAEGIFNVQDVSVLHNNRYVPLKNGRFATTTAGDYIINYRATAKNGLIADKTLTVKIKDDYEFPLGYEFGDIPSEVDESVGKVYLTDGNVTGGYGKVSVTKKLTKNGQSVEISKNAGGDYFVAETIDGKATEYVYSCLLTDITGVTAVFNKTIIVKRSSTPIIGKVTVPKAIRVGYKTEFAKPTAKVWKNGVLKDTTIEAYFNGEKLNDFAYTPNTAGKGILKYVAYDPDYAGGDAHSSSVEYEISVLALKEEDSAVSSSWFLTENCEYVYSTEQFAAFKMSGKTSNLFYANILSADFSAEFGADENSSSAVGMEFTLTDSIDADVQVKILIKEDGEKYPSIYVNGVKKGNLANPFKDNSGRYTGFSIDAYSFLLKDTANNSFGSVETCVNGEKFNGFPSGGVYADIRLIGNGKDEAVFYIYSLNHHGFTNSKVDRRAPDILLSTVCAVYREVRIGDEFTVYSAKAYDVFSGVKSLTVSVQAPDKSIIYEGVIDVDKSFKASACGSYGITYTAIDTGNKKYVFRTTVSAIDVTAPMIENDYAIRKHYLVGETVTFPQIQAHDDVDEEVQTYIVMITPDGEWKILKNNTYTFAKAGRYRLRLVAQDASLNTAHKEYEIEAGNAK